MFPCPFSINIAAVLPLCQTVSELSSVQDTDFLRRNQQLKYWIRWVTASTSSLAWVALTVTTFLTSGSSAGRLWVDRPVVLRLKEKTRPWHQVALRNAATFALLEATSAGLLPISTFLYWEGSDTLWISETWLATKTLNLEVLFLMYLRTKVLSVQNVEFSRFMCSSFLHKTSVQLSGTSKTFFNSSDRARRCSN